MSEIKKILEIAEKEIGYLEKSKKIYEEDPTILYDKIKGAGSDNYTKYAKEMDELNVYNTPKQGYAWCNVFIDWCFVQAFGKDRASELLLGFSAGCTADYNNYRRFDQITENAQVGDLVFFGECEHIGIIYNVTDDKIFTIEGNTSNAAELITNGGQVAKKSYFKTNSYIFGYARPKYKEEESLIRIQVHVQNKGWLPIVGIGEIAGTTGEALPLEAIVLDSDIIELNYRVHLRNLRMARMDFKI